MKEKEPQAQRYNIQQRHNTHTTTNTANIPSLAAIITTETTSNPSTPPGLRVKKKHPRHRSRIRVPPGRALDWEPGEVGDARCRDWREPSSPTLNAHQGRSTTQLSSCFQLVFIGKHETTSKPTGRLNLNRETRPLHRLKQGNPATRATRKQHGGLNRETQPLHQLTRSRKLRNRMTGFRLLRGYQRQENVAVVPL